MRRILGFAVALLASTMVYAATPVNSIDETFDATAFSQMDNKTANNETIKTAFDTGTNQGSRFAWGGCTNPLALGTAGGDSQVYIATGDTLFFKWRSILPGSRAYTRFDTTSALTAQCTNSEYEVNAAAPGYGCKLTNVASSLDGVKMALLIRNSSGWFQSGDLTLPNTTGLSAATLAFEFSGLNAVSWQALDTSAGYADMDEVDNGGEGTTLLAGAATPVLSAINGMGLIITSAPVLPTTNTPSVAVTVSQMTIQSDVLPPAAPAGLTDTTAPGATQVSLSWTAVSGAAGYNVYRSATSGGAFTKLTTTPQVGTTYTDTTVTINTTYYYKVTAVDAAVPSANESVASAEVSAKAQLLSAAREWFRFF